jgi:hypothetical protein
LGNIRDGDAFVAKSDTPDTSAVPKRPGHAIPASLATELPPKFDRLAMRFTRFVRLFTSQGHNCNIRSSAGLDARHG